MIRNDANELHLCILSDRLGHVLHDCKEKHAENLYWHGYDGLWREPDDRIRGFHEGGTAPIFTISELSRASFFVDPVPQALTLTSIVIGAGTTALALSLAIMAKKQYGTVNTEQIRRLNG